MEKELCTSPGMKIWKISTKGSKQKRWLGLREKVGESYMHACTPPMSACNSSEASSPDTESYVVALLFIGTVY